MNMMKAYQFNNAMTAAQAGADSFRAFSAMNIALLMDTILMVSIFVISGVVAVVALLLVLRSIIMIIKTTEYGRMRQVTA